MKTNLRTTLALALLAFAPMTTLTSCSGGFFASEEQTVLSIKEIKTETDEEGNTLVTIIYNDEEMKPVTFTVPKGEQGNEGQTGNGIASITYKDSEDGTSTIVTVTMTDGSTQEFSIPNGVDGANGYNITNITSSYDEETGLTTISIITDNPKIGNHGIITYTVNPGKDGADGVGIQKIESKLNSDNTITLTIYLTNGSKYTVTSGNMKGDTGRGITSIVGSESGSKYVLTINYSDGTTSTVKFDKPKDASQWLTGSTVPEASVGKDGDFYFDTYHQIIYQKVGGVWIEIVNFQNYQTTYTVKFNLNDNNDAVCEGLLNQYTINRGEYFASSGHQIPLPTRAGYDFGGWYLTANPNPTSGAFTDLTPVFSDLVLYANWLTL